MRISALIIGVYFTLAASAAKFPEWKYKPMKALPENAKFSYTKADHENLMSAAQKYKVRSVAGVSDDSAMPQDLKDLRDSLNALGYDEKGNKIPKTELYKEAMKLHKILTEAKEGIEKKSNDYKFVVAHLAPMAVYRSFVYRMIPVVRPSQALRQALVDTIQESYSDMKLYFPDTEWEVGFVYLTEPFEGTEPQFQNESEVQEFFLARVASELHWADNILEKINILPEKPLIFDNRLVYGKIAFPKEEMQFDRFTWVRQYDVWAARGRVNRQLYGLYINGIYDMKKSAQLAMEMASIYGIEVAKAQIAGQFIKADVMAPTRKDRVGILKHNEFAKSFLKNPYANKYIDRAINHLKASVSYNYVAWDKLKDSKESLNALIDPGFFKGRVEETRKGFMNATNILFNGEKTMTSVITRNSVTVDLEGFLRNLPQDSKLLLPVAFDDQGEQWLKRDGVSDKYRNYAWERAIAWDASIYKSLFPQLKEDIEKLGKVKADAKVKDYMRTMTESRGGSMLADSLLGYIR